MAKGFSKKAALYIRVSTSEQAESGVSLDAQMDRLIAYCRMAGLEVVEVIREEGISGTKPLANRPGGSKLLDLIKTKKVQHVVALKLDRLFRNASDALHTTEAWDKQGISVHFVDMGGTAVDTSSAMGRMMLTMLAGFAQFESDLCAERTKSALKHKKAKREVYSPVPLGFVQVGKQLVADASEQAIVATIQALRAAGKSLRAIASELTQRGMKTKKGGNWYASTIKAILDNDLHSLATIV